MLALLHDLKVFGTSFVRLAVDFGEADNFWPLADSWTFGERSILGHIAFHFGTRSPEVRRLMKSRYSLDLNDLLSELESCPEGSLGAEYRRHMERYNLTKEFFPPVPTDTDFGWWRQILREEHDLWHLVSGYRCFDGRLRTIEEELAFQCFQLGQTGSPLCLALVLSGTVCMTIRFPWRLPAYLLRMSERAGRSRSWRIIGKKLSAVRSRTCAKSSPFLLDSQHNASANSLTHIALSW
jgi:hypothetical protein